MGLVSQYKECKKAHALKRSLNKNATNKLSIKNAKMRQYKGHKRIFSRTRSVSMISVSSFSKFGERIQNKQDKPPSFVLNFNL